MNLYLADKNRIKKFILPDKAMESFLFPFKLVDGTEIFLNIKSNDGVW